MKKYTFEAEIRAGRGGGAYVVFPYDTEKEFGTKGKVPVSATIDGVADRGGLFAMGKPYHMLGVPKAIREQIEKGPGAIVKIVLWKDEEKREVEVPPEFKSLMKKAGLLPFFEGLSFTHRQEYSRWITEAKKEETRARRVDKAIEMLKKGVRTPG
ncbi:MAG: antitermination protein NusB [Blastocatellia bacterium]|nr:MAG: antitermination protein NusB [Blastocatellia bacterium]